MHSKIYILMHSKIYILIFCLFLSNSNHNQAANSTQNHTKTINGWMRNQAGILYFTPIDNNVLSRVKTLTISHAHIHKIMKTEPSFRTLERNILSNIPELDSFLNSNDGYLSTEFLQKCYKDCKHEYNNCKIISSVTTTNN